MFFTPKRLISLSLLTVLSLTPLSGLAKSAGEFQTAPLNPAFVKQQSQRFVRSVTEDGHVLGYRPGPVHLSLPRESTGNERRLHSNLPAAFDLRTQNRVTPVRDQGSCGACWTFATLAPLESTLLPAKTWDFSENNLRNNHLFDWSPCDGGNSIISTANLARWNGPVLEEEDPYSDTVNKQIKGLAPKKHVQNVLYLPERQNPLDNDAMKESLMQNDGIFVGLAYQKSSFNARTAAYYNDRQEPANHAVTIIGWDDHYNRNNFVKKPQGDGAFIAKNSWGTNWGDNGFFYISYYDLTLNDFTAFDKPEAADNYRNIYQYDELGFTDALGNQEDTAWFANIFTAKGDEQVKAAGFYTVGHDATYEVQIYTDVDTKKGPVSGQLAGKKNGKETYMGYHTVKLDEPVAVKAGSSFAVVVKVTVPDSSYPIPLENKIPDYSSRATASKQQSYVSTDGSEWDDLATIDPTANVALKAFTDDAVTVKELNKVEIRDANDKKKLSTLTLKAGDTPTDFMIKATYKDKSTANVSSKVKLKRNSNKDVVDVKIDSDRITVTPKSTGAAKLLFTFEKKTVTLSVKVK